MFSESGHNFENINIFEGANNITLRVRSNPLDIPQLIDWENPSELKDFNVFDDRFEFEEALERKSGNVYRWNKYDWDQDETMQDLVKWRVVKGSINILRGHVTNNLHS